LKEDIRVNVYLLKVAKTIEKTGVLKEALTVNGPAVTVHGQLETA
jgi:hypothetical protein